MYVVISTITSKTFHMRDGRYKTWKPMRSMKSARAIGVGPIVIHPLILTSRSQPFHLHSQPTACHSPHSRAQVPKCRHVPRLRLRFESHEKQNPAPDWKIHGAKFVWWKAVKSLEYCLAFLFFLSFFIYINFILAVICSWANSCLHGHISQGSSFLGRRGSWR